MNRLLEIKHWQLWIVVVLIPIAITVLADDFSRALTLLDCKPIVAQLASFALKCISLSFFLYWFWVLGTSLYQKSKDKKSHKIIWFKWAMLLIVISYIIIALADILYDCADDTMLFVVVLLINLFMIYCLLYSIHFITALINALETNGSDTSVKKYNNDYVLLLVFPIGIWFMQARINAIFKSK